MRVSVSYNEFLKKKKHIKCFITDCVPLLNLPVSYTCVLSVDTMTTLRLPLFIEDMQRF